VSTAGERRSGCGRHFCNTSITNRGTFEGACADRVHYHALGFFELDGQDGLQSPPTGGKVMTKRNILPLHVAATAVLILPLSSVASAKDDSRAECMVALEDAMVRLAGERIDGVFGAVAASTRALGDTYARLAAAQGLQTPPDARRRLALRTTQGHTTGCSPGQAT
jgi:hypothetical protein